MPQFDPCTYSHIVINIALIIVILYTFTKQYLVRTTFQVLKIRERLITLYLNIFTKTNNTKSCRDYYGASLKRCLRP